MNQTLAMDVRKLDGASVIDVKGDVTGASEEILMAAFSEATEDGATKVVLNFAELEYMNSGGIGLLVTMLVRANRQGQRMAAFGLSDHYRQIFELTRLDDAISIHDSESDAIS